MYEGASEAVGLGEHGRGERGLVDRAERLEVTAAGVGVVGRLGEVERHLGGTACRC